MTSQTLVRETHQQVLDHIEALKLQYPHEYSDIDINDFRSFMNSEEVFGKDDVIIDDELIHVIHGHGRNLRVTSFTFDDNTLSVMPDGRVMSDDFLDGFPDDAKVFIESGYLEARSPSQKNRFVQKSIGEGYTPDAFLNSINWVYKAWSSNDPSILELFN